MGFRNLWNKISTTASVAQSVLRKDVPYTMGEEYARCGMWTLHYGVRKTDKQQVTIFKCRDDNDHYSNHGNYNSSSSSNSNASEMAQVNARRLRAIRHPSIIAFIDTIEMGGGNQLCIVTEFVRPLRETIIRQHDAATSSGEMPVGYHEAISWGLFSVIRAIEFLHSKNMYLGALPMHSVFVDEAGEWKIGDLSFLSEIHPHGSSQQQQSGNNAYGFPLKRFSNLLENRYKPPELISQRWDIIEQFPDTLDSWGVACLIHEVFEGEITHADQIRGRSNLSSIPRGLNSHFKRLVQDNPTARQRIPQLLESPYFDSKMIQTQLFLENIAIKDPSEIGIFISELSESIDTLPRASAKYKILPHLFNAIKYGSGGASQAITTIFKIGSMMDENEYGKQFIPEALNLFDVNSRAVRVGLLKNLGQIVPHLDSKSVEKRVYPHIAKGFVDPDPMLRAESLKSLVALVPKLREKIVAEEVVKYMWTLQTDREPGIRTNTIIAFGMLAPHFSEDVRKRVMLHAFARSMKDPYVHARVAALKAFNATKEYYTVKEVATKIIPVVSPLMVDTEQIARETAAQVLQIFLQFTIEISKSPNFHEFLSQTKTSAAGSNGATSNREANTTEVWSWAMNAVSSVKTRLLGDSLEMSGSPIISDSGSLRNSNRQVGGDRAMSDTSGDRTTTSGYGSASRDRSEIATNGAYMNAHPKQQQQQQQRTPLNNSPSKKLSTTQHQKQSSKSGWEDDDLFDMSMRTNDTAIDNFLDSVSNNSTTTTTPTTAVGSGHSNSAAQDFDPFADLDPFGDTSQRPSSKPTNRPNLNRESKSESYRQASDVFNLSSSRYHDKPHTNSDDLMPDFALDSNNHNTLAGKNKQNEWQGWDDF